VQVGGAFLRRQRQVALGQQAGDVVLGVEDGLRCTSVGWAVSTGEISAS
jgi:hypothetical protein